MAEVPDAAPKRKHRRTGGADVAIEWSPFLRLEQVWFDDLRELCRQRGLTVRGTRAELVERLDSHGEPFRESWERGAMTSESGNVLLLEWGAVDDVAVQEALASTVDVPCFAQPLHAYISTFPPCPPPAFWEGAVGHELYKHLREQCGQGQWIWRLTARRDVVTLQNVFPLLRQKGFSVALALVLCGFLHILYWHQSISVALALILAHPAICPTSVAQVDVEAWAEAIQAIMAQVSGAFKDLRVVRGQLVQKPAVKGTGAKLAVRNPSCWNRSSDADVKLFAADFRSGAITGSCNELASMLLEGRFDYGSALSILRGKTNTYYTGLTKSYISVHYLRCMRVAVGAPAPPCPADFKILLGMGAGVRRWGWPGEQAAEAVGVIKSHDPSSDYQMDDLACFMCMSGS
ncbi:unnamed protein product [Prorocentrum cordatum]|uniref:SAP domain-containing protein n=1 Tax=Prorocentrum cordatum TaxID=2364126 RepID=A0ABN9WM48_9DINO|nr:unnamed protein product [Polarella glacialis]